MRILLSDLFSTVIERLSISSLKILKVAELTQIAPDF
jgi:hypothetical protein